MDNILHDNVWYVIFVSIFSFFSFFSFFWFFLWPHCFSFSLSFSLPSLSLSLPPSPSSVSMRLYHNHHVYTLTSSSFFFHLHLFLQLLSSHLQVANADRQTKSEALLRFFHNLPYWWWIMYIVHTLVQNKRYNWSLGSLYCNALKNHHSLLRYQAQLV